MKYNWKLLQEDYDTGLSIRDLCKKHGVHMSTVINAKNRGDFVTRSPSEAQQLWHKNNKRNHTEQTKQKLSIIRREYLAKNPHMVPYKLNHYSKGHSYAEQYFYDWLCNNQICFREQLQIYTYQLDFAIDNIDLEINGEQHYVDQRIYQSDIRRYNYLNSNGWSVIPIRWSWYKKQSQQYQSCFLDRLQNILSNKFTYPTTLSLL